MKENADTVTTLERLTPELSAEVRRNLVVFLVLGVIGLVLFCGLFAIAVDPDFTGVTGGVAVRMFALFLALMVPSLGLLLTLVYLFDCWPATLRGSFLRDRYRVPKENLSGSAWRRTMGEGGFWAAAGRGAIVGWAFVSATGMIWWAITGKWSLGGPSAVFVVLAAQFAARAWFVRRAVATVVSEQPNAISAATEAPAGDPA